MQCIFYTTTEVSFGRTKGKIGKIETTTYSFFKFHVCFYNEMGARFYEQAVKMAQFIEQGTYEPHLEALLFGMWTCNNIFGYKAKAVPGKFIVESKE